MKKMRSWIVRLAAAALATSLAAACVPPPPHGAVYVRVAPPAPVYEEIGVAPGPEYIWIRGHHRWEADRYMWVRGHWERRPRARARWVEGHWRHGRQGWYWVEGHWR